MTSSPSSSTDPASRQAWLRVFAWAAIVLWTTLAWRAWDTALAWQAIAAAGASLILTLCLVRAQTQLTTQLADERARGPAQASREALLGAALAADIDGILAHSAALLGAERAWLSIAADGGTQDHQWPMTQPAATQHTGLDPSPWWRAALGASQVFLTTSASSGLTTTPSRGAVRLQQDQTHLGVLAFEAATGAGRWGDAQREQLHALAAIVTQVLLRQRLESALAATQPQDIRERRLFIAGLNHKLRTPMTAVLGFAQILDLDPSLAAEQREFVREIESAGQALLAMLNELADVARG